MDFTVDGYVIWCEFSYDGQFLCYETPSLFYVFDVKNGKTELKKSWNGRSSPVQYRCVKGGVHVVLKNTQGELSLMYLNTGEELHLGIQRNWTWSHSGEYFFYGDTKLNVLTKMTTTLEQIQRDKIASMSCNYDGSVLGVLYAMKRSYVPYYISIVDTNSGAYETFEFKHPQGRFIRMAPSGKQFVIFNHFDAWFYKDNKFVREIATRKELTALSDFYAVFENDVYNMESFVHFSILDDFYVMAGNCRFHFTKFPNYMAQKTRFRLVSMPEESLMTFVGGSRLLINQRDGDHAVLSRVLRFLLNWDEDGDGE